MTPPATMTLSLYGARLTGCPLDSYFSDPHRYAEGQQAVVDHFRPDIVFSPFVLAHEAASFGSQVHPVPEGVPNVKRPAAGSPEAFLKLLPPSLDEPHLAYLIEATRSLANRFGGQIPVCGVVAAPIDLPILTLGMDVWIETLVCHPDLAQEVLSVTTRHFVTLANALLAAGAAFVALPVEFTNPALVFPKMITEVLFPTLAKAFQQVKGPLVYHHGGNRIGSQLTQLSSLPNVAGFVIDHRDNLSEARQSLGPGPLLLGNLNGPTLLSRTTESALLQVESILKDRHNDPKFIFATTGADVPLATPPERIHAVFDAVRSTRIGP